MHATADAPQRAPAVAPSATRWNKSTMSEKTPTPDISPEAVERLAQERDEKAAESRVWAEAYITAGLPEQAVGWTLAADQAEATAATLRALSAIVHGPVTDAMLDAGFAAPILTFLDWPKRLAELPRENFRRMLVAAIQARRGA